MITKIFKNRYLTVVLIVVCALSICIFSACAKDPNVIEKSGFPNTVAENAKIADKYKDVSQQISDDAVNEYFAFSKIPHRTNHEDQLCVYLENWAKEHNFSPVEGPGGCMYFDVPATPGCENYPNLIFQTHMDMVVTYIDKLQDIDPNTLSVDAVKDDKTGEVHAKDYKTNCGADDGEGIGLALAFAKNKNIKHGPIRLLFTTAEEIGCMGAQYVPADFINADYLINMDGARTGEVVISSAGYMNADYTKSYQYSPVDSSKTIIQLNVSGLSGGHSGMDIAKPRKSATSIGRNFIETLNEIDQDCQVVSLESGNAYNAIPNSGVFVFAINDKKLDAAKEAIAVVEERIRNDYADDRDFQCEFNVLDNTNISAISHEDSETIKNALNKIPHGLIKMSDIQEGVPESSLNIGYLNLKGGNLRIGFSARSNNQEYMSSLMSQLQDISKEFSLGYKVTEESVVPVWPTTGENSLSKLYLKGMKEETNLVGYELIMHGAVEPARFYDKHPGLVAISLGTDVKDEHSISETWYTKSLPVTVASILHLFENLNTLK